MDKIDRFYYINLDRAVERKEHFLNECDREGLPSDKIFRYTAIDGKTLNIAEYRTMFSNCDYAHQSWSINVMGNQLSHYNILLDIIQHERAFSVVFQDDVIFRPGFAEHFERVMNNITEDSEIINIGFHHYACLAHFEPWDFNCPEKDAGMCERIVNDAVHVLRHDINPCSLAYIVTLEGAKNMVEYFNRVGFLRATDHNFNDYLKNKNIFYASRVVLCTGNHNFKSDVFV